MIIGYQHPNRAFWHKRYHKCDYELSQKPCTRFWVTIPQRPNHLSAHYKNSRNCAILRLVSPSRSLRMLDSTPQVGLLGSLGFGITAIIGMLLGRWVFPIGELGRSPQIGLDLIRWDANAYLQIAEHGYRFTPQHLISGDNIAYFPGYPLLEKMLLLIPHLPLPLLAVGPALFAGFISIFAFAALARQVLLPRAALWATLGFALYPGASFMLGGYPTTILNLFAIMTLWRLWERRYWQAALWSAGGTLFGPMAVVVALAIPLSRCLPRPPLELKRIAPICIQFLVGIGGLLVFVAYQMVVFHNPLAFVIAQNHWGSASTLMRLWRAVTLYPLTTYYGHPWIGPPGHPPLFEFVVYLQCLASIVALGLIVWLALITYRHLPLWLFIIGLLLPLTYYWSIGTVSGPVNGFRLLFIDIPAFLGIGFLYWRRPPLTITMVCLWGFLLAVEIALSLAGYMVV